MEIAEQVIAENIDSIDDKSRNLSIDEQAHQIEVIHNSFKHLYTSYQLPCRLYRSHCQQIINHLLEGNPPPTITDAELLLVLSRTSNHFPINREYRCAFSKLFIKWFPDEAKLIDETSEPETYDNYERQRADEIIAEMRDGLSNKQHTDTRTRHTVPALDVSSMQSITDFLKV